MGRGLAEIRGFLARGESAESWLGICEVLDEAEEASEREMLVEYVSQHTAGWGESVRRPLYVWWERKQRGEETEYEGLVGDWSMFVWGEGKAAGEVRVVPFVEGMRMRWIPAGTFRMGAGDDDNEAWDEEKPQHEVTITRGFWIGETPVTQGQYETIMGENPSLFTKAGFRAPVVLSWYEAAAFANQLSVLEGVSACFVGEDDESACFMFLGELEEFDGVGNKGSDYLGCKGWRLPTEAEWEYACHAGTTTPCYGDVDKIAWCSENSDGTIHPVGEKEANAWGLHDMLGNVWEWCYDWYKDSYEDASKENPVQLRESDQGEHPDRVVRGGGWYDYDGHVRSTFRKGYAPNARYDDVGFRLLRFP